MKRKRRSTKLVFVIELVALVLGIGMISFMCPGFRCEYLFDIVTLLVILVFSVPVVIASGLWKDFTRVFQYGGKKQQKYTLTGLKRTAEAVALLQKQILSSGCILTFIQAIVILFSGGDLDTWQMFVNLAVVLVAPLYTAILELLLVPLGMEAKLEIMEYMERDE